MRWISLEPCGIAFQKCTKIDANTTHAHTHNNRKREGDRDSERSVKKTTPEGVVFYIGLFKFGITETVTARGATIFIQIALGVVVLFRGAYELPY